MKISAWYKEQLEQEKLNNRKRVLLSSMAEFNEEANWCCTRFTSCNYFCSFILCRKHNELLHISFNENIWIDD